MGQQETPTAIVTGASSGVGLHATKALVDRGWHVVMACRDLLKAEAASASLGIAPASVSRLRIDLGSQASVRHFVDGFGATGLPLQGGVTSGRTSSSIQQAQRSPRAAHPPTQPPSQSDTRAKFTRFLTAVYTASPNTCTGAQ